MRHRRLSGAILLLGAGLLTAIGRGRAGDPPRVLDLDRQATPLPPPALKVIASSAPSSIPTAPRPPAGPIRRVVYEPTDPEPPPRPLASTNGLVAGESATSPGTLPPAPAATGSSPHGAPAAMRFGSSLALEVVGPSQAAAGQAVPVEIVVRNTGAGVLTRVRVEAPLPAGARLLTSDPPAELQGDRVAWSVGSLDAGGERRLRLDLQPAVAGELALAPVASFTPAVGLRTPVVRPPLALAITGPESAAQGAKVVFQIQAINNTDAPLEKVIVRVQLPPGLFHPEAAKAQGRIDTFAFPLAPGETRTLPLEVRAAGRGRQVVEVLTAPDSGRPAPPVRAAVVVSEPPLSVLLEAPRLAAVGRDFDLRVRVVNPNPTPAANVRLAQSVPQGLEVLAASPGATPAPGGQGILWPVGTLDPGQERVFTCTFRPRSPGDWPLYTGAAADNAGEARASQAVHVDGAPPLAVEVMARDEMLAVGGETVFEVRVLNTSDQAATNVRLTTMVPVELAVVQPQGPTEARLQPPQVLFAPLTQLGPHADAVYRIRVRARQGGQGRFRVELAADQLARPLLQECGALVQAPR